VDPSSQLCGKGRCGPRSTEPRTTATSHRARVSTTTRRYAFRPDGACRLDLGKGHPRQRRGAAVDHRQGPQGPRGAAIAAARCWPAAAMGRRRRLCSPRCATKDAAESSSARWLRRNEEPSAGRQRGQSRETKRPSGTLYEAPNRALLPSARPTGLHASWRTARHQRAPASNPAASIPWLRHARRRARAINQALVL